MTQRLLRYLSGAIGLVFILIGISLLLAPGRQSALFAIMTSGPAGLSTVRADLAGLFLGMGAFSVVGAVIASDAMLMVPTAFLVFIAAGRLVNLIADGRSSDALRSLTIEVVAIGILTLTVLNLRRTQRAAMRGIMVLPLLVLVLLGVALQFQRPLGMLLVRRNIDSAMSNQLTTSLPDGLHAAVCFRPCQTPHAPARASPSSPDVMCSWSTPAKAGRARWR